MVVDADAEGFGGEAVGLGGDGGAAGAGGGEDGPGGVLGHGVAAPEADAEGVVAERGELEGGAVGGGGEAAGGGGELLGAQGDGRREEREESEVQARAVGASAWRVDPGVRGVRVSMDARGRERLGEARDIIGRGWRPMDMARGFVVGWGA